MKLAALLCVACAMQAQIRTETKVVLVDTVVTDKKGAYVHDLTAKDFRLWEDNKEQVIQSAVPEKTAAASQASYLVLFFSGIEPQDGAAARQAVTGFIDANTEATHMMAVVHYNNALKIAQNFTANGAKLKDGVNRAIASEVTGGGDFGALDTIRAIAQLARNMSVLPGRKVIVFVNGGLGQASVQKAEIAGAIEACNRSDVAVYPIDIRPVTVKGDASTGADQRSMLGNRRGGQHGGDDADPAAAIDTGMPNQQLLFRLATGTGGFVIASASELQRGLQKVGEEQSEYYLLSYTPVESKEGTCHELRVKVDRGGSTVRARSNYCESKPQDLLAGTIQGQDLEKKAATAPVGGVAASMQLSYFYLSDTVARVHVAMELPVTAGKLNLLGIANAADGAVAARFSDSVAAGGHYEKEFKIAPGKYTFTMALTSGKLEAPLVVEPRQPGELAMSGIALSREGHPAAEIGLGAAGLVEDRTPLIADDVQLVPTGSNTFAKSDKGFFYFEVYAADLAVVRVRVRVLSRGTVVWESGAMTLSGPHAGSRLPLDSLETGAYELELTAADSTGKQVTRTAAFEVK
jgi:VWFA-related protein